MKYFLLFIADLAFSALAFIGIIAAFKFVWGHL